MYYCHFGLFAFDGCDFNLLDRWTICDFNLLDKVAELSVILTYLILSYCHDTLST